MKRTRKVEIVVAGECNCRGTGNRPLGGRRFKRKDCVKVDKK